jgi:hypothetical protein
MPTRRFHGKTTTGCFACKARQYAYIDLYLNLTNMMLKCYLQREMRRSKTILQELQTQKRRVSIPRRRRSDSV